VVFPSITIGIATSTPDDRVEDFRHRADLALYHGKESNRGGLHIYSPEIGTAISRRCDAVLRVAAALKEDRLEAWYQPIVKIDSGECVGLEALARIRNPNGTVASASEFHEATRDAHIAASLTHRMFQKIASDLGAWCRDGIAPSYVAINLSAADLKTDDISGKLELAFAAQNVPFSKAVLEITESVYLGERDRRVVDKIADLRKMGLRVALDDFGTGFASLSHLISVPIDIIKIDKSFVDRLGPEGIGNGIIEGILHIAKSLKVRVVAEGVETSEQAQFLQRMACRYAQGYLFSKPLPSNAATRYLNAQMGRFNSTSFASPTKRRKH
jgi:EAL domain-containing protein (putative c-di-GMP-specific phosphodiesterase class I)